MKNIQIPADLFFKLCRYFDLEDFPDYKAPEDCMEDGCMDDMYYDREREDLDIEIRDDLKRKLDALARHELYSQYKNKQLSDEERQAARKAYLDSVGMREGYRWKTLDPPT